MIKNIMVSIGDTNYEKNAFDYAGHLAILLDAHLSCVYFQEELDDVSSQIKGTVLARTEAKCEEFKEHGLKYSVESAYGKVPKIICEKTRTADLFVIGIPESIKTDGFKLVYNKIDSILLKINRPTIVVHEHCEALNRILVTHRGDDYSDKVLQLTTELSELTDATLLGLAIAETIPRTKQIAKEMSDYLKYHDATVEEVLTEQGFTVANVLDTATERDCDLIALSASSHGKIYEMIFNSVTESVVKLADRAVVVAR